MDPVIIFFFTNTIIVSSTRMQPIYSYSHVPNVRMGTERDTTHGYGLELTALLSSDPGDQS